MKTNAIVRDGKKNDLAKSTGMEVRHRGVVKMKGTDDKRHTKGMGEASHVVKKKKRNRKGKTEAAKPHRGENEGLMNEGKEGRVEKIRRSPRNPVKSREADERPMMEHMREGMKLE